MRIEYKNTWFRILIELLERQTPIRRHRVVPVGLDRQTYRQLRRRIDQELRQSNAEASL